MRGSTTKNNDRHCGHLQFNPLRNAPAAVEIKKRSYRHAALLAVAASLHKNRKDSKQKLISQLIDL